MTTVSVLVPSRNRPGPLEKSLTGMLSLAAAPWEVEILVAVDPDDTSPLSLPWQARVWTAPQRYGYGRLHEYYNALAAQAQGEWLLMWNDDAAMETPGWDQMLTGQPEAALWPYCSQDQGMNVFPLWPAAWARELGHLSLDCWTDRWMQSIGEMTGRLRHIPFTVSHERIAGGDYGDADVTSFWHPDRHAERAADAARIRARPGDPCGHLVSLLLPGGGDLPALIGDLQRRAADLHEVEFLVAAGDGHPRVRRALEGAGLMGRTEVHTKGAVEDIACHARGGHVARWDGTAPWDGWDEDIRGRA